MSLCLCHSPHIISLYSAVFSPIIIVGSVSTVRAATFRDRICIAFMLVCYYSCSIVNLLLCLIYKLNQSSFLRESHSAVWSRDKEKGGKWNGCTSAFQTGKAITFPFHLIVVCDIDKPVSYGLFFRNHLFFHVTC